MSGRVLGRMLMCWGTAVMALVLIDPPDYHYLWAVAGGLMIGAGAWLGDTR